jgi:hypothetical protein
MFRPVERKPVKEVRNEKNNDVGNPGYVGGNHGNELLRISRTYLFADSNYVCYADI